MSTSLLRIGHLRCVNKCLQTQSWNILSRAPTALTFSTKSSGSKNSSKKTSKAHMDPVQRLFLDSIREYSTNSQAAGGLVDAGSQYQKVLEEEIAKLQRLYGGGDLTSFPNFKFTDFLCIIREHCRTQQCILPSRRVQELSKSVDSGERVAFLDHPQSQ